jgi:hypothetical protein
MSKAMNTTALQNINPLTVEIPAAFALAFEANIEALETAAASSKDLREAAEKAGFTLAHLSRPTADSTPEHRFNYAMARRMAAQRLAFKLGAPLASFEPVFNEATESKAMLTIGGETKTKKAWQQGLGDVWKYVKKAWMESIRTEADDLRNIARAAKAELDALKEAAEKTAMVVDAQEAQEQEVQKQLALANAEAEAAATAKEKAKAKAKLAMVEEKLEAQRALVVEAEAADQAALLACAIQAEALDELNLDVQEKLALLPAARGTKERKNKVDAFAAKLDALIKEAAEADDLGNADLDDLVHHLKEARKQLNQVAH